jgi:hypothetical protein
MADQPLDAAGVQLLLSALMGADDARRKALLDAGMTWAKADPEDRFAAWQVVADAAGWISHGESRDWP